MRVNLSVALLAALLAGCKHAQQDERGGGGDVPPGEAIYFADGVRLSAVRLRVGGIDIANGWFDRVLGEGCAFWPTEDGVSRCLPGAVVLAFVDPACSEGIAAWASGPCDDFVPHFAFQDLPGTNPCRPSRRMFEVTGTLAAPPVLYRRSLDGLTCEATPAPTDGVFGAVAPVSPDRFVAEQLTPRPRAEGLLAVTSERDDGSWEIVGLHDPLREGPCGSILGLDSSRCVPLPQSGIFPDTYVDAACSVRGAPAAACGETPRSLVLEQPASSACGRPTFEVFEVGERVNVAPHYDPGDGQCVAADQAEDFFTIGAAVASLPSLEMLRLGEGPATVQFLGHGGQPYLPYREGAPLVHQDRDACHPAPFTDGVSRCVPNTYVTLRSTADAYLFADAGCSTEPLFPQAECGLPAGVLFVVDGADPACGRPLIRQVRTLVAYQGPSYLRSDDGTCSPSYLDDPMLRPGEAIEPTTFGRVDLVVPE